jgi:hypothetical protein
VFALLVAVAVTPLAAQSRGPDVSPAAAASPASAASSASSASSASAASPALSQVACAGTAPHGAGASASASAGDSDRDGLSDACELAVAQAFAPELDIATGACNVIGTVSGPQLGGGYLFAAAPIPDGIRVAYMPAYFRDCGWHGFKCHLPGVDCTPHWGDSEFIAVDLIARNDTYELTGVFLSAHCFGRSGGDCKWYRGEDLAKFRWSGAHPIVWVANGRNANYASRGACDRGHWRLDTCSGGRARYRFPLTAARNVGSRSAPSTPRGCITSHFVDAMNTHTSKLAEECIWDGAANFRGWQTGVAGVTPYSKYLEVYAGM